METIGDEFVFSNEFYEDLFLDTWFTPPVSGLWQFDFDIHWSNWEVYWAPVTTTVLPGKLHIDAGRSTNFVDCGLRNFGRCRF